MHRPVTSPAHARPSGKHAARLGAWADLCRPLAGRTANLYLTRPQRNLVLRIEHGAVSLLNNAYLSMAHAAVVDKLCLEPPKDGQAELFLECGGPALSFPGNLRACHPQAWCTSFLCRSTAGPAL